MANPLASLPASVKLRCSTTPPQVVTTDYNGTLATVFKVAGVTSLPPAGASPTGSVIVTANALTGSKHLCCAAAASPAPTSVPINSTLDATEFSGTTIVESTQADYNVAGCTLTATGELVKLPTTANTAGLVLGARVTLATAGGAVINANCTIGAINNLTFTAQVTGNGTSTVSLTSGVVTLEAGQFVNINGTNYTVNAAVVGASSFVLAAAATLASGTYIATFGPVITLGINNAASASAITTNSTSSGSSTITVAGHIRVSDAAIGSLLAGAYTFNTYAAQRTFADVREGDYFEMAVGLGVIPEDPPTSFVYLHGYVRRPDAATKTFLVWDQETGGSPVSTVESNASWFVGPVTSEAPYLNVYQRKALPFPYQNQTRLRGRLVNAPPLNYGTRPPAVRAGRLNGRLVAAPTLVGLAADQYIHPARTGLVSRMPTAPALGVVEKSMLVKTSFVRSRLTAAPRLTGGYLRLPSHTCRAILGQRAFHMMSNGEAFTASGRLTSRVPYARLTGHEMFRRKTPIRGLINATAVFVIQGRGLSVRDVFGDCLSVWNKRYESCGCLADDIKDRAISDINAALQVIYSRAGHLDYFNKQTITVSVGAGVVKKELPNTIQQVLGTVRRKATENAPTSVPLTPLTSLAEAMQFGELYAGTGTAPYAYYIDTRAQAEANVVQSLLMLAPVPTSTVYVDIEVAMAAPRYTWRDVELATPLQLPSTYAETLLIPIVRQRATSFRLFNDEKLRVTIEGHYRKAQAALGLLDSKPRQAAKPQTVTVEGTEQ